MDVQIELYIIRAIEKRNWKFNNYLLFEEDVYSDYFDGEEHDRTHFYMITMDESQAYDCWEEDYRGNQHNNRADGYRFVCSSCDKRLCLGCFVGCFNRKENYYHDRDESLKPIREH